MSEAGKRGKKRKTRGRGQKEREREREEKWIARRKDGSDGSDSRGMDGHDGDERGSLSQGIIPSRKQGSLSLLVVLLLPVDVPSSSRPGMRRHGL